MSLRAGSIKDWRAGTVASAVVLAFVLSLVPVAAFAAGSVDASPVVTVAGSVSSVTGTVTVRPVDLSPESVAALGSAVASASSLFSDPTGEWSDLRSVVWAGVSLAVFWLALLVGFNIGRL